MATDNAPPMHRQGTELKGTLSCDAAGAQGVESLVAYSRGFAAGQVGGVVTLFERAEREREGFRRARSFSVHEFPLRVRCGGGVWVLCVRACVLWLCCGWRVVVGVAARG